MCHYIPRAASCVERGEAGEAAELSGVPAAATPRSPARNSVGAAEGVPGACGQGAQLDAGKLAAIGQKIRPHGKGRTASADRG